jgi:hypothetical protein
LILVGLGLGFFMFAFQFIRNLIKMRG